jgi:hypothetical protein
MQYAIFWWSSMTVGGGRYVPSLVMLRVFRSLHFDLFCYPVPDKIVC